MTVGVEEILQSLAATVASDSFFPAPEIDAPEPSAWRTSAPGLIAGLGDACAVQGGPVTVTRDGGAEDDYELHGEFAIAYVVQGQSLAARRARRNLAAAKIEALIAADRTLGLDPQVYAAISEAQRDDFAPLPGAAPCASLIITVGVDFIGASPAS